MAVSGKGCGRRASVRGAAGRALLVILFACLSAGAALLGASLLALVGGFVAAALLADVLFPVTGFLRADSQHAFERLVWQRRRETLVGRRPWRHEQRGLELLPCELEHGARRRHLGIQPISIDSIIGTIEPQKAESFDHAFRPPAGDSDRLGPTRLPPS